MAVSRMTQDSDTEESRWGEAVSQAEKKVADNIRLMRKHPISIKSYNNKLKKNRFFFSSIER